MKKVLLAAAVASFGLSAAQAAPTLYGKLNVSLNQVDNKDFKGTNETQLNSNASRIGVKGEEKLTDNVGVVYQAEWAISTDGSGSDTDLSARNRFLGLKFKDIGTLKAGQYDSYFKTSAGKYQDIFNDDTNLDITKTMYGEERLKNAVGFETDKNLLIPGLQFNLMAQTGENITSVYSTKKRDSFSGVSTSLSYENKDYGFATALAGNFAVAGAYNALSLKDIDSNAYRVTGSLDLSKAGLNGLVLGALFQHAEPSNSPSAADLTAAKLDARVASLKEQAWILQATYNVANTPWTVKGQYQSAKTEWTGDDRVLDQYGVGVDYNLNKQARLYGVLAQQKRDWQTDDNKKTVFGLGMEYNF
ncbi:porin [Acinetobacter silvestris]|uniref:Porin n=1 Tax=Acinetobacter silvestris TaxID=1977882 RepID=A0A1Y3CJ37_9GAMM|nr:porin [Acinetobacter silvestris]OTG65163.1 porin [Acinetobacter silvestris]